MTRNVRLITLAVIVGIGVLAVIARNGRAQATADAQASQVNGKIAADQQFGDPFIINKDGSGKDFLGLSGSTACQFWSPDGRKLACNVFSDNGPMPATVRRDGSHFRYLNAGLPLDFFCMYWSPNGRRLLCHSEGIQNPADAGFYTARSSDAGGRVRITTTRNGLYDLAYGFSPDGRRILFGRFDFTTNTGTLYVVNRDGSHQVRLSPPRWRVIDLTFFDQVGADWSRNGSRVTFAAINQSKQGSPSRLFVVDADGGNLRAVGPRRLNAISAQWSPSRRLITFTSCCASNQV